ncbi:MAG: hypothetical protein RLZZ77_850 [Bacteroidota bacterium]
MRLLDSMASSTDRIQLILNAKPEKRTALILQAVILGLAAHIFVLAIMYLVTAQPPVEEEAKEEVIEELDIELVQEEELLQEQLDVPANASQAVKDLIASSSGKRTSQYVNYTGKSRDAMNAEVEAELAALEAAEKAAIASQKGDIPVRSKTDTPKTDPTKKNTTTATNPNNNPNESSYSGPVSAEFSLNGRSPKKSPRPNYRCKSTGKVVVKIKVDYTGEVIEAQIDESKSQGNDCIREESLAYARRWAFDYNDKAPKKQDGTITFTFSAQ